MKIFDKNITSLLSIFQL